MPRKRKAGRKSAKQVYHGHVDTMPMMLRTTEAKLVRPLNFITNINSDGSGNTINYQDVGTLLSSAGEWSGLSALYRGYRILKCTVQVVPIIKMTALTNLLGINYYEFPFLTIGYNPNTYGVPAGSSAVLSLPASFVTILNNIQSFAFQPVYTGGDAVGQLDVAKIGSGQWGSIQYYGNSFDLSLAAWYLRVVFLVEFTRQL
jgi:hypothetical protein